MPVTRILGHRGMRRRYAAGDAGFAAVDALVALLILSSTLVLSLDGLQTAARLSRVAQETGQATALARMLLAGDGNGQADGRSADLVWRLDVERETAKDNGGGPVCLRRLVARSLRDGRTYHFSSSTRCG